MTGPTVGRRLAQLRREKSARDERDIDQTEIAKAIGIGAKKQSYISRWEKDLVKPSDGALAKLAAYYGVTVGWLRYGEGEKHPAPPTATAAREKVADPSPPRREAAPATRRQKGGR